MDLISSDFQAVISLVELPKPTEYSYYERGTYNIIHIYNRTGFFRKTFESAKNQTLKCRILVVDNNSPHNEFTKIVDGYNNPLIEDIGTSGPIHEDDNFNNYQCYNKTLGITFLHYIFFHIPYKLLTGLPIENI